MANELHDVLWGHGPKEDKYKGKIKIWFDPEQIDLTFENQNKIKTDKELDDEIDDAFSKLRQDITASGTQRMGQIQSLSKSHRLLVLKRGIESGKIKYAEDVMNALPEITSLSTVDQYLRLINMNLPSTTLKRRLGPSDDTIMKKKEKLIKQQQANAVYFDKDPDSGGKEITYDEYLTLVLASKNLMEVEEE